MKRTSRVLVLAVVVALAGAVLQADVKVQDKHQLKIGGALGKLIGMFAGKSLREPTLGTTAIKGDRKLVIYGDYGQIVDLQEEKIYTLDVKNKTYKVRTFEEARKAAREAREKLQQRQAKEKPDTEKTEKEAGSAGARVRDRRDIEADRSDEDRSTDSTRSKWSPPWPCGRRARRSKRAAACSSRPTRGSRRRSTRSRTAPNSRSATSPRWPTTRRRRATCLPRPWPPRRRCIRCWPMR